MASNQNKAVIVIAAVAAGAYFLITPKKASAATTPKTKTPPLDKPSEEPKDELKPDLPGVDDEDYTDLPKPPGPNLPDVDDEDYDNLPKPPEESPNFPDLDEDPPLDEDINNLPKTEDVSKDGIYKAPDMDVFYQKWLRTGGELPLSPDPFKLWVSETCQSWGVGKNWAPYLLAKYAIPEDLLKQYKIDPDQMILPTDYWDVVGGVHTPDPVYVNNLYGDLMYFQWARNLLAIYAPQCYDVIPKRKNYGDTGFKQYNEALKSFMQTNFGQLFRFLANDVRLKTYDHWAEKYPDQADTEDRRGWALWAVRTYPKYSAIEQTDQAYKKYFENDPNAPKKINPKLASHKPYQKTWIDLNEWVKSYRNLISKWG